MWGAVVSGYNISIPAINGIILLPIQYFTYLPLISGNFRMLYSLLGSVVTVEVAAHAIR